MAKAKKTRAQVMSEGLALVNMSRLQRGQEPLTPRQWADKNRPKKPSERQIMDALARKVKSITAGETSSRPPAKARPHMIDAGLKAAVRKSGRSYYDLGQAAGIAPSVILRFMSDDPQARGGDMRLSTAAKLAAELGLELTFTG